MFLDLMASVSKSSLSMTNFIDQSKVQESKRIQAARVADEKAKEKIEKQANYIGFHGSFT